MRKPHPVKWIRKWADGQNHRLDTPQSVIEIPDLPEGLEGMRLLVFSDLHFRSPEAWQENILREAASAKPDCILIPGDLADEHRWDIDALTEMLCRLSDIAPCAAVLGNNDCYPANINRVREIYRKADIVLLEDESRTFQRNGAVLRIIGLSDPLAYEVDLSARRMEGEPGCQPLIKEAKHDGTTATLILLHRPERTQSLLPLQPALFVCGHVHGGQFRFFGRGLFAPEQGFFPHLTGGLYRSGDCSLYISRGLGSHGCNLRINNHPHLPLLILKREKEEAGE